MTSEVDSYKREDLNETSVLIKNNSIKVQRGWIGRSYDFRSHFGEIAESLEDFWVLLMTTSEVLLWCGKVPSGRPNSLTPEFIPGTKKPPKVVIGGKKGANGYIADDEHQENQGNRPKKRWKVDSSNDFRSLFKKKNGGFLKNQTLMTATSEVLLWRGVA